MLNDCLLDQIPPLIHLKQSLYQMSLSEVSAITKQPLIIEIYTEVRYSNYDMNNYIYKKKIIPVKFMIIQIQTIFCFYLD